MPIIFEISESDVISVILCYKKIRKTEMCVLCVFKNNIEWLRVIIVRF